MTKTIEILREEHRSIEKLLLVLEQELEIFERRERPDYEILQAVINYFQDYPDRCHHPKEDMIFAKLKARDPVAAEVIGDLESDHQQEAKRLRGLAQAVGSILTDHDLPRQAFGKVVRDFVGNQRRHMSMEERVLFPAAAKALRPEDWAGIDAQLNDQRDPLPDKAIEERFKLRREQILAWEQDNRSAAI